MTRYRLWGGNRRGGRPGLEILAARVCGGSKIAKKKIIQKMLDLVMNTHPCSQSMLWTTVGLPMLTSEWGAQGKPWSSQQHDLSLNPSVWFHWMPANLKFAVIELEALENWLGMCIWHVSEFVRGKAFMSHGVSVVGIQGIQVDQLRFIHWWVMIFTSTYILPSLSVLQCWNKKSDMPLGLLAHFLLLTPTSLFCPVM